ncbi:MAG TPA: DUF3450 domain-containing protein [Gammaproteobacteria bacterium]
MKSTAFSLLLFLLAAMPVVAQDANENIDAALDRGEQRVDASRTAQERIDAVNARTRDKIAEYRDLEKQIAGLDVYVRQLRLQLENQDAEIAALHESIDNVTLIERQITPLMLKMIDALGQHVKLDVPFLPEERAARVERLRAMISRSDVSVAEKFRAVFDAYQTELEYGRTIEAYRGMLELADGAREVDFLRVGRIGLYYMSLDGSLLGAWNREARRWEPLSNDYRSYINEGLGIAREQAAPDLIRLPLPAPQPAPGLERATS